MLLSLLKWILLLDFLLSMHIWIEAFIPALYINIATIFVLCVFIKRNKETENLSVAKSAMTWTALYCLFLLITGNTRFAFSQPFYYLPGILLCLLTIAHQKDLLLFVSKSFAMILSIGFIIYIIDLIVDLPPVNYIKIGEYNAFENYVFLIKSQSIREFFRFQGPFAESGHMSMICALILYANQYKLRNWYNIIFIVSILFSLSLAGYVLLGLGIILYFIKSFKKIGIVLIGFFIASYVITDIWNKGDNLVNEMIIKRLQYDDDKIIVGNNRFDYETDYYYKNLSTEEFLGGLGLDRYNQLLEKEYVAGAGYKIFILINGLIGCFFVLMIYYSLTKLAKRKKYAIGFLILMIASFLQRSYPTWMAWLLPFICGITTSNINNNKTHTIFI